MHKILYNNIIKNTKRMFSTNLHNIGIVNPNIIYHNLNYLELRQHELKNREGDVFNTQNGHVIGIDTGKFTGRSPNDKWIVQNKNSQSDRNIWWGDVNQPTTPDVFKDIFKTAVDYFNTLDRCYVFDGYCGTNPQSRKRVRFIHELAWQQHFVTNMFIRPTNRDELKNFTPDFTIINACAAVNEKWKQHNLNSEVAIIFNIEEKDIKLNTVSNNDYLTNGNKINKIDILFKKIEKNND